MEEEQAQAAFDELDAKQKAEFMRKNIAWARGCDLSDELELRNDPNKLILSEHE